MKSLPKPRPPRAYYISGFGVGTGVPRVEILAMREGDTTYFDHRLPNEYLLRVVSRRTYAFAFGETFYRNADSLFDHISYIQGPKLRHWGKAWFPAFLAYDEARRNYENAQRRKINAI